MPATYACFEVFQNRRRQFHLVFLRTAAAAIKMATIHTTWQQARS